MNKTENTSTADSVQEPQPDGLWDRLMQVIDYCKQGVWEDTRSTWWVKAVKVVNLSVNSFLDRDLQMRAGALTFNTVLALVPALALLFAIGRGFGFQNLLQSQLMSYFPAQQQALETALTYVDNYLSQASQGAFIGVGLVVLLWTMYSLMSSVEETFNRVWGITHERSIKRKFSDYTALMLLMPVLMVCSAGISIFMSDAVQQIFGSGMLSPMAYALLELMPIVITWIVFAAAYWLVPNTRVDFWGALWAGVLCGTLFHGVQWLFVTGQVYVSKYNAIYGSFAFLPLLLIWLQLSWLIALAGVVLTYAWQNIHNFVHRDKAEDIAPTYFNHLAVAVLAMAVGRFCKHEPALKQKELESDYDIPSPLASRLLRSLERAGLLVTVKESNNTAWQPAYDLSVMTVGQAMEALADVGNTRFITTADKRLAKALSRLDEVRQNQREAADTPLNTLLD